MLEKTFLFLSETTFGSDNVSTRIYGVPLKLAFLDIKFEENSACDCPTKLEDWWQSSAERNFVSHC